eukprot:1433493-Rhodomonas_salina.3
MCAVRGEQRTGRGSVRTAARYALLRHARSPTPCPVLMYAYGPMAPYAIQPSYAMYGTCIACGPMALYAMSGTHVALRRHVRY